MVLSGFRCKKTASVGDACLLLAKAGEEVIEYTNSEVGIKFKYL